ncbi:hypothetical protein WK39_03105 [Burkholderia cepacia]|uniref:phage protein n=1 Tax=Burkholderia cepacia TaxID=292 RepID=UPI0007551314|nr:hypothetical protein [Burkholderia cepacia]KVS53280.1 hypothetical protein WK39_03105 [Burkholderia cepacia]KVS57744.1 hypothetical protein WK40_25555 [Burkholderia cepacia]CAG9268989.1 conserved hypothetical protein [Burkholderia cepacia]
MTVQFLRKISLLVGTSSGDGIDLSDLRVRFYVQRGDRETPNSARIRVYNLSGKTANTLVNLEFTRVVLQAGYEGNFGIIFDGSIVQARRGRESPTDTYVDITAADGDAAYLFAHVNLTLAAGSTAIDHFNACAGAMVKYGVRVGYVPDLPHRPLPRGKVMSGPARSYLREFARTTDTLWSIQSGKLQVVPRTSVMPGEVQVINSRTGMIGLPQQTIDGINVTALLNPRIQISCVIQLNNNSIQQAEYSLANSQQIANYNATQQNKLNGNAYGDGYYYVMDISHWGDTRGNDWYTHMICLAVDATLLNLDLFNKSQQSVSGPVPLGVINGEIQRPIGY